jgi:hypothetical protein
VRRTGWGLERIEPKFKVELAMLDRPKIEHSQTLSHGN